jgi:hypothetical protein
MQRMKAKTVLVATMLAVLVALVGGCHSFHRHDNDYNYSRRGDYGRYDDRYYGHRYNYGHRDYNRNH